MKNMSSFVCNMYKTVIIEFFESNNALCMLISCIKIAKDAIFHLVHDFRYLIYASFALNLLLVNIGTGGFVWIGINLQYAIKFYLVKII